MNFIVILLFDLLVFLWEHCYDLNSISLSLLAFRFCIQLGITRLTLMQRKDGSNLLMLSLTQFHKRRKESFFSYGGTLLKKRKGTALPLSCHSHSCGCTHIESHSLLLMMGLSTNRCMRSMNHSVVFLL
jgi:hypothetical protein